MTDLPFDYGALLRQRGFRMTPQRQIILEAIDTGNGHTAFDEIFARVHARSPALNRATLYRTLEFLRQQRLILSAEIGGQTVYEIARQGPHHHLVCVNCKAITDLHEEGVAPVRLRQRLPRGFRVKRIAVDILGVCAACSSKGARAKKV